MTKFLAESQNYKVYSIYENVYLKNKNQTIHPDSFDTLDLWITCHYGDPSAALILPSEKYIVTSGCGLSIYSILDKTEKELFNTPGTIHWINGIYTDSEDCEKVEFRYIDLNSNGQLRIFKLNVESMLIKEL